MCEGELRRESSFNEAKNINTMAAVLQSVNVVRLCVVREKEGAGASRGGAASAKLLDLPKPNTIMTPASSLRRRAVAAQVAQRAYLATQDLS